MIPRSWSPVTRPTDGQTVGYLAPAGRDAVPTSLVGTALGHARDPASARALLVAQGLRALDRRWWCRLPDPLPRGVLPAAQPRAGWQWRPVVLVEASPTGCTVRPELAPPRELQARAQLPVPVGDLLREQPPG